MGYLELAYLHMLFHGYFKALLFIGRGVRIHSNYTRSQDLRNLSNSNRNPYLIVFFLLGNLGLIGVPFFGGFLSKHLILMTISNPYYYPLVRVIPVFSFYFARIITIGYSLKTLILIIKNASFINYSNYRNKIGNQNLYVELSPTLFLRVFVVFFPSVYLLYSNIEEVNLSLYFAK